MSAYLRKSSTDIKHKINMPQSTMSKYENEYFLCKLLLQFIIKLCALFLHLVVSGLYFLAIMQHLVE